MNKQEKFSAILTSLREAENCTLRAMTHERDLQTMLAKKDKLGEKSVNLKIFLAYLKEHNYDYTLSVVGSEENPTAIFCTVEFER